MTINIGNNSNPSTMWHRICCGLSNTNFNSWMAHLISNPELAMQYGQEMEKMRLAMEKEKQRLSEFHKYTDDQVDQPFLTPETVRD